MKKFVLAAALALLAGSAAAQGIGVAAPAPGGVISIGQAFGWLQPYIDSAVDTLIAGAITWASYKLLGNRLDQGARDALTAFLVNRANSLIADGFVAIKDKSVRVDSAALANEANMAAVMIPDAVKRFGITPELVAEKIKDAIPQTTAGAAMIAAAPTPPATPAPAAAA